MASSLKVLFFDIETAPLLAHIWQPKTDYVPYDFLVQDSFHLTWAAKWRGEEWIYSDAITPQEAYEQDDSRIVRSLGDLVRSADVVVAHNGDQFDLPKLNGRLALLGEEPLGPVQSIDTLKLAKKNFRLAYNKLDYLGAELVGDRKIKTDFDLWRRIYWDHDQDAIDEMQAYNEQDVLLLEEVFEKMLPYVRGLTRLMDADIDGELACPSCGSHRLTKRGTYRTQSGNFQRYSCDECGRYMRGRKSTNKLGVHPL